MQIKLFLFAFVERKYLIYNYEKREHKKTKISKNPPKILCVFK